MSSREIAELTGKEHKHVIRDIRAMIEALEDGPNLDHRDGSNLSHVVETKDARGYTAEICLPKRETLILVSGYDVHLRAKIIDRWQELEAKARQPDPMAILNNPSAMRGLLLTYSEKVIALEAANAELAPKAVALDRIATADGSLNITEAAKVLQINPKGLFAHLQQHGWIYKRAGSANYLGYQTRANAGDLTHKVNTVLRADGTEKVVEQVRITPKGLAKLAKVVPAAVMGSTH